MTKPIIDQLRKPKTAIFLLKELRDSETEHVVQVHASQAGANRAAEEILHRRPGTVLWTEPEFLHP